LIESEGYDLISWWYKKWKRQEWRWWDEMLHLWIRNNNIKT